MTLDRESIHQENLKTIVHHRRSMEWLAKDFAARGFKLEPLMDAVKADCVLALLETDDGFPDRVQKLHLLTRNLPGVLSTRPEPPPATVWSTLRLAVHHVPGAKGIPVETKTSLALWDGKNFSQHPLGFQAMGSLLAPCLLGLPTSTPNPPTNPASIGNESPWPRRALLLGTTRTPSILMTLDAYTKARLVEHMLRLSFPGAPALEDDGEPTAETRACLEAPLSILAAEFRLRSGGALDPLTAWRSIRNPKG